LKSMISHGNCRFCNKIVIPTGGPPALRNTFS
jgi:hypothetical protein